MSLPAAIARYAREAKRETQPCLSAAAYLRDGAAIYERSFAIIRAEADLSRFSAEEADVAVRMIHACGAGRGGAAHRVRRRSRRRGARRARRRRADPLRRRDGGARHYARAAAGAQRGDLHAQRSARAPLSAQKLGTTRSAAALDLWRDRLAGAVVAIGNAPTALFRLLDLIDAGAPKPAAILGIPVGFVGAAESKEALAADPRGVPFLIVRGRMGGSAMTAAAVNALARPGL